MGGQTKLSGGTRNLDEASMDNDGLTQGMKSMEIDEDSTRCSEVIMGIEMLKIKGLRRLQ